MLYAVALVLSARADDIASSPGKGTSPLAQPAAETSIPAEAALKRLLDGNARFVSGRVERPDQTRERRAELAKGQAPFAVVLTCADSRVSPELFFDQGLGDLFVIRNAGNVLDDHVIGSIEYAVEHLPARLVMVVGHEKCGAVSAAVAGGETPGHIHSIVESIQPALENAAMGTGDRVDQAVRANALRNAEILNRVEPVLKDMAGDGKLLITAARYELASGKIELLQSAPSASKENSTTPHP